MRNYQARRPQRFLGPAPRSQCPPIVQSQRRSGSERGCPAGADPPPQPGEGRKSEGNAELCQLLLGSRTPLSSRLCSVTRVWNAKQVVSKLHGRLSPLGSLGLASLNHRSHPMTRRCKTSRPHLRAGRLPLTGGVTGAAELRASRTGSRRSRLPQSPPCPGVAGRSPEPEQ